MGVRKGFIFTMDAIFAILIVMVVIINSYSIFVEVPDTISLLDRTGVDILFVLDENGTIATENNDTIKNTIDSLIPNNVKYDYNITYYNVTGSTLQYDKSFIFSSTSNETNRIVNVRAVPVFGTEEGVSTTNLTKIARVKLGISI